MTTSELVMLVPLLITLTWAVVQDVRTHRIRNWLTLTLIATGVVLSCTPYGMIILKQSLFGMLIGFILPFSLFAIGGMGAGDVKLIAGIGAWIGPWPAVTVFVVTAVLGAGLGLILSLWQGRAIAVLRNTAAIAMSLLNAPRLGVAHVREVGQACGGTKRGLPYAVPIWIGTVLTLFTPVQAWLLGR